MLLCQGYCREGCVKACCVACDHCGQASRARAGIMFRRMIYAPLCVVARRSGQVD